MMGKLYWHVGKFEEAIREIEAYHTNHAINRDSQFWLAISYMRAAENQNCLSKLVEMSETLSSHKTPTTNTPSPFPRTSP